MVEVDERLRYIISSPLPFFWQDATSNIFFSESLLTTMVQITKLAALAAACVSPALAHPGEKHDAANIKREIVAREHWAHAGKRSLDACSNTEAARRFAAKNKERRARIAKELREQRGITAREMTPSHTNIQNDH